MSDAGLLLVGLALAVGVVGVVVPVLPGLLLSWATALVWTLADDNPARWPAFALITLLAVVGTVAKYVLPGRRLSAVGAPRTTLYAGAVGAVVGFFVIPFLGLFIGGIGAVLLAEWARLGELAPATASTRHVVLAVGLGILIELAAALGILGVWLTALLLG